MLRPIIALYFLAGIAHAGPSHATQEAPLVKAAEKIKLYCGNPQLAFVIDWPAFENLDFQLLIAGREGGSPSFPGHADDLDYVSAARTWILTGNKLRGGLPGAPIAGASGIIVETFERLCRDHAEMRAPAAKITKIVLEPINDMKYLSNKDAIAFARRTNDWSGVEKAMDDSLHMNDAEDRRTYYNRYALKGSTLTVTFNIMARGGDADDYVKILMPLLDSAADNSRDAPTDKPAKTTKKKPEPPKPTKWGPPLNCKEGTYADLSEWEASNDYAAGALVYQNWAGEPTEVYRCKSGSGCHHNDGPGSAPWTQVGHCSSD